YSFEMGFRPSTLEVAQAGRYTIKLINEGVLPHDITFPDGTAIVAQAGETVTGEVDIPAEGLSFICAVPGHEQAGMVGTITVAGAAAAPNESDSHSANDHGGPAPELDVVADPNAPAYQLFDAKAPTALSGTVHDI